MKKFNLLLSKACFCLACFTLLAYGCVRPNGIRTNMSYDNLKAVSLRELQKRIAQNDENDIASIKSFYGITRLYGFLWDNDENDLILFGETDNTKEPLNFDDFVVSLRNVYYFYSKTEGNTIYYTDPSCTIDPDPNIINLLSGLIDDNTSDPDTKRQSWESLCSQPQSVGVMGIPFNSHLAAVMVNADYFMKDITNGNIKIDIEGDFKSLHQLRKEIVEESMKNNKPINLGSPMNRFEFTAQDANFRNSENLYLLYSLPVQLITEEEYISQNSLAGTGNQDPFAKRYADDFSRNYERISEFYPLYESLLQAYRTFAIAKTIMESNLITDTTFFSEIFHHYPLDEFQVPISLPGKSVIDQVSYKATEGYSTHYLYSCGGVNLGSKVRNTPILKMKAREIMNNIILSRPDAETVEWTTKGLKSKYWIVNFDRLDLFREMAPLMN